MPVVRSYPHLAGRALLLLPVCLLLAGGRWPVRGPDTPCKLFTPAEIKTLLGVTESVDAGSPAISGCQWATGDQESYAQVQIIADTSYYEPHKGAKEYREEKGVGLYGWSAYELGGWVASSNTGRSVLVASVTSPKATRETALKFLGLLAERAK